MGNFAQRRLPLVQRTTYDNTIEATVNQIIAAHQANDRSALSLYNSLLATAGSGAVAPARLRDSIITLLTAGHETVAAGLMWSCGLLFAHPKALAAVQEEIAGLPVEPPNLHEVSDLPYVNAVIREALRLYPPAWRITRTALCADLIDGYAIAPGTSILLSVYAMQRHPAFWPAAASFRPERFLKGAAVTGSPLAWLPFGRGPRTCIGADMGLKLSALLLVMLLQRYVITPRQPLNDQRVHLDVTLRPAQPQWVTLTPAKSPAHPRSASDFGLR